jgi:E3 ubiquitin-protein ligase DOA10
MQKIKSTALIKSQNIPKIVPSRNIHESGISKNGKSINWNGDNHPPKNTIDATNATINMFAYSLRKNNAHLKPEYSVIHPATNSDSASGISNGVLLVSATTETK